MPEILTESFCERCGTRYTFQTTAPKARRGAKLKVLSKGVRNFVLNDETTLSDALADARSDVLRDVSSGQLDAFHQTFNFCMTCRQYTCSNCWNEAEGRCLTCAPHLGHEILPAPFPNLVPGGSQGLIPGLDGHPTNGDAPRVDASAWPELDLRRSTEPEAAPEQAVEIAQEADSDAIAAAAALEADALAEAAARAEAVAQAEAVVEAEAIAQAEATAMAEAEAFAQAEAVAEAESLTRAAELRASELDASELEAAVAAETEALAQAEALAEADAVSRAAEFEAAAAPAPTEPEVVEPAAIRPAPPVLRRIQIQPRVARPMKPVPIEEWLEEDEPEPEVVAEVVAEPEMVAAPEPEVVAEVVAEPEMVAAPETVAEVVAEPEMVAEPAPDFPAEPAPDFPAEERAPKPAAQPSTSGPLQRRLPPRTPESIDERAAAAASQTADLLARFRPDHDLEEAIADFEEYQAVAEEQAAEPEPAWPIESQPEPVAAEVEPVAAAEPEPAWPVEPAPQPIAAAKPTPEPTPIVPVEPRVDRVETPVWTTVAPETAFPVNGEAPQAVPPAPESPQPAWPSAQGQPQAQWPAAQSPQPGFFTPNQQPQWPSPDPSQTVPFLDDTRSAAEILWAASNQEVLARPAAQPATGVQPCVSCGLSLSANARFCRRCGTRQG